MLETIFGSKTRARMLALILLDGRTLRLLELQRAVGTSISSVQRELVRLESLGLTRSDYVDGTRVISAVEEHPLAAALRGLLAADQDAIAPRADPLAVRLNPVVGPHVAQIADACRRFGVTKAALVGSATQTEASVRPADIDVLVRFDAAAKGYADRYFGLLEELEAIIGMPVEIIEEEAVANPYLRAEFAATQVMLYEAA